MFKKFLNIWLFTLLTYPVLAQTAKTYIREGNKSYEEGKFTDSENSYKKALETSKNNKKAIFNLGDAYYKQGKFEEAASQFDMLSQMKMSKDSLSQVYHNLGNSYLQSKKYEESIKAYKSALRNNPSDQDTRYNLAYAMKMLKQEQQKQQNKDKQENKEKQQENKDQNKDQQNKDQKRDVKDQQQKQQAQKMTKEDAERLMKALNNEEKKIQKNLKKQNTQQGNVEIDKDW